MERKLKAMLSDRMKFKKEEGDCNGIVFVF